MTPYRLLATTLLAIACTGAVAQGPSASPSAKTELVQKILAQQQGGIDNMARGLVERPAMQLMQAAANAVRAQVPPDRQEAVGRSIEADVRKFVDDAVPIVRERATKLVPTVYGTALEEKFTEDELRKLLAWLDSPVNKKFQQTIPEVQNQMMQKLVTDAAPVIEPKLQALQQKVRATLTATPASAPAAPGPAAKPAARAASR
jgi:hypothetical protein